MCYCHLVASVISAWEFWIHFIQWPMRFANENPGLSGWIQAVSSVGAIYWASKIATDQSQKQHANALRLLSRQSQQELLRKYEIWAGVLAQIIAIYDVVIDKVEGKTHVIITKDMVENMIDITKNISPNDAPDAITLTQILSMPTNLKEFDDLIERYCENRTIPFAILDNKSHPFTKEFYGQYSWLKEVFKDLTSKASPIFDNLNKAPDHRKV